MSTPSGEDGQVPLTSLPIRDLSALKQQFEAVSCPALRVEPASRWDGVGVDQGGRGGEGAWRRLSRRRRLKGLKVTRVRLVRLVSGLPRVRFRVRQHRAQQL